MLPSLNLSRPIVSGQFLKELATKIPSASVSTEDILNESDLRDKLVQGKEKFRHTLFSIFVFVEDDELKHVCDSLHDLLRMVKTAAETTLQSKIAMEDKDKAELYQTITKLKSLLAVKR